MKKQQSVAFILGIALLFFTILFDWKSLPFFSTSTGTIEPTITTNTPSPTPAVNAVAKNNVLCISKQLDITIYQFAIVSLIATNGSGGWGEASIGEGLLCWVNLEWLSIIDEIDTLPVEDFSPPATAIPTTTPTPTSVPSNITLTPPFPIVANEFIVSYDCDDKGKVTGVLYNLNISGGVPLYVGEDGKPRYRTSPELLIYAAPERFVSITVYSNTSDGKPDKTVSFMVPDKNAAVYKCVTPDNPSDPGDPGNPDSPSPILPSNTPKVPTSTPKVSTNIPKPIPTATNLPSGPRECNDGIDNDGDGKTDYPTDDGCKNQGDDSE